MEDGVFEWNGSSWVSLMTPTAACPGCGLDGTLASPPTAGYGLTVNTFAQRPGDVNTIVAGTAGDGHTGRNLVGSGLWLGQWNGSAWRWANRLNYATVGDVYKVRWQGAGMHVAAHNGYFVSFDAIHNWPTQTWVRALSQQIDDLAVVSTTHTPLFVYLANNSVGLQKTEWSTIDGIHWTHSETTIGCTGNCWSPINAGRSVVAVSQAPGQDDAGTVFYMPNLFNTGVQGLWKVVNDVATQVPSFPSSQLAGNTAWTLALTVNPTETNQIAAGSTSLVQTQDGGMT